MSRSITLGCALAFLGAGLLSNSASAQAWQEEFTNGSNDGAWEIWWSAHNQVANSGGNPGGYLHLDNLAGPSNCHWLEIFPVSWPAGFTGDWRAAGIDGVGLDVNLVSGPIVGMGEWTIRVANDNGTPGNLDDDCFVEFISTQLPPQTFGWMAYDFAVPAASLTLPAGWTTSTVGGPCGASGDAIWNSVITNVSYFRIKMDTDPAAFCIFSTWDFGVDNLRVTASAPISFCFGDGSGTPCPCGNSSAAGEGCANSAGAGGRLSSGGSSSVSADSLTFAASQLLPNQPGLLFVGNNAVNGGGGLAFGDGLRCAGNNVIRLGVRTPDAGGNASWGPGLGANGGWAAGDTRRFQVWYRDPVGSPCATGFNLTQGLSTTMTP